MPRLGVQLPSAGGGGGPGAPASPRLLFVVERGGPIRVLRRGRKLRRPFLDISGLVASGGERGLPPAEAREAAANFVNFSDEEIESGYVLTCQSVPKGAGVELDYDA